MRSGLKAARLMAGAAVLMLAASCVPAGAQTTTTSTSTTSVHSKTLKHGTAHKTTSVVVTKTTKFATTTKTVKRVPVVAPRRPGPLRHATVTTAAASRRPLVRPVIRKEAPATVPDAALAAAAAKKPAVPPADPSVGTNTGLHLPRYASLKSDDVNMRVGPAERYPVIWTYKRRELPVKIDREFDIWRLVEDMDGVKGWVHQATLTGRRTFVVLAGKDATIRSDASDTADAVAVLKPGVVGRIKACEAGKVWCQVQVQDYRGWLQRSAMWGVDADEVVAP